MTGTGDRIDANLEALKDEALTKRKEAEAEAAKLSSNVWRDLRAKCKEDLFFLSTAILGFDKLSPGLHGHLTTWMDKTRDDQFRMFLLPRAHYKSTVITIGDSIRAVLPDDTGNRPWPENLGTNCRLCIAHETRDQAADFLFAITSHFLSNTLLLALFPETQPSVKKHRVNKFELELPRKNNWPEATIDTMSTGARGQGRHYNWLKLDDLIGDKARDSKIEMDGAKQWLDNIQAFFSTFARDRFDLTGTRWAGDDIYDHMERQYDDLLKIYRRAVVENGQPIFPEEFTLDKLKILQKNDKVWTAQYLNDPKAAGVGFDDSWLKFYEYVDKGPKDRYVVCFENDPLTGKALEPRVTYLPELDIVFLIDPAMSGELGWLVTGTDKTGRKYILEEIKRAMRPPEFVELLFKKVLEWRPRVVVIEEVLFSALYEHYLTNEMVLRGTKFKIQMERTGQKEKDTRVIALASYFQNGEIWVNHKRTPLLIEEYTRFGGNAKYHLLDALAYGPRLNVWQKSSRLLRIERTGNSGFAREAARLASRDAVTGYSKI
jgi:predicted phage terminase large subunit-like protein